MTHPALLPPLGESSPSCVGAVHGCADHGQLRLCDQLCFALYSATNAIVRTYRPMLAAIGLTYTQYLVMMALWGCDRATVKDLAAQLDLRLHGISPVLERLETSGLLRRQRDPADRRTTIVTLTDTGRRLEHEAARVQGEVGRRAGLSPTDLAALRTTLHTLAERLDAQADDTRGAEPA